MLRSHAFAAAVLAALVLGCVEDGVTRVKTLTPDELAALGPRAHVIARDGKNVTAEVTYGPGDTIPGEGVVRRAPNAGIIAAGLAAVGLGVGLGAAAAELGKSPCASDAMLGCPNELAIFAVLGSVFVGAAGVVLTIVGIDGSVRVDENAGNAAKLRLAPFVSPGGGGGSLRLRF